MQHGCKSLLLALLLAGSGAACTTTSAQPDLGVGSDAGSDAASVDAESADTGAVDLGARLRDAGPPTGVVPRPASVALPSTCGVTAPQACNPLDGQGCDLAAGQTCDLGADGTFQCFFPPNTATAGAPCEGINGPYCGVGLTCVGALTTGSACKRVCCEDSQCGATEVCRALHAVGASRGRVGACVPRATAEDGSVPADAGVSLAPVLSHHRANLEGRGHLVPWTTFRDALAREMRWYDEACPPHGGYPIFASATHYGGDCGVGGDEVVVAMQNGTGILSYLQYDAFTGHTNPKWLATARLLGDYVVDQARTPSEGLYPRVPRSTGRTRAIPQPPDCGNNEDMPYEFEPDKAGLAGYALLKLAEASGDTRYSDAALETARALAANIVTGDARRSPWAFRVDYRTGVGRSPVSSNMSYILRLFDGLIAAGHSELAAPRETLWRWIADYQIPNCDGDGQLWVEFYENHSYLRNRNAWAPLSLARYLMEKREAVDPDWRAHTDTLVAFVNRLFWIDYDGFPVCIEQDLDRKPFGGILSTYGAVMAQYAALTGNAEYRGRAYLALSLCLYAIDDDGCPNDLPFETARGGWQQDAHTDKVHNFMTALSVFPEWAD